MGQNWRRQYMVSGSATWLACGLLTLCILSSFCSSRGLLPRRSCSGFGFTTVIPLYTVYTRKRRKYSNRLYGSPTHHSGRWTRLRPSSVAEEEEKKWSCRLNRWRPISCTSQWELLVRIWCMGRFLLHSVAGLTPADCPPPSFEAAPREQEISLHSSLALTDCSKSQLTIFFLAEKVQ